jgi:hypothetical protein
MKKFICYVKDGEATLHVYLTGKDRKSVAEEARGYYPDNAFRLREVTPREWKRSNLEEKR